MEYQCARLQYQFGKLRAIRDGVYPSHGGNVEFELFSFFEICHHLKDWVKESPRYSNFTNVEAFINASTPLRIAADICNRLKHKVLKDRRTGDLTNQRSKGPLDPFNLRTTVVIGPDADMAKVALTEATITTERGTECCFNLAQDCMEEWSRYFTANGVSLNDVRSS